MSQITRILATAQQGDSQAAAALLTVAYDELRRLAAFKMASEAPGQTLQPTALVHEVWLRLSQHSDGSVWYRWTGPEPGGWITFDMTSGTPFDSLLAVYTGDRLERLVPVAASDNYGTKQSSRVTFAAARGTDYSVVVSTREPFGASDQGGPFKLAWYPTPPPGFTGSQLSPSSGIPGTRVTLSGTNFTGATSVLFNSASATFTNAPTNNLDLRITAVVPSDAISGPITIVTPHGKVTSTTFFHVLPPPLTVQLAATNELEITWPATSTAFVLEEAAVLNPASLVPVSQAPFMANGESKLTLTPSTGIRFYRLKAK